MKLPFAFGVLALAVAASHPVSAFEPTGNAVADAFLAALEGERQTVTNVGEVSETDGTVSIESVTLSQKDATGTLPDSPALLEGIVIRGGDVTEEGLAAEGLSIALQSLSVPQVERVLPEVAIRAEDIDVSDLVMWPGGWAGEGTVFEIFQSLGASSRVGLMEFILDDRVTVSSRSSTSVSEPDEAGVSGQMEFNDVTVSGPLVDERLALMNAMLGTSELVFDVSADYSWAKEGGALAFEELTLSEDELGSLTIGFAIDGLTSKLVDALAEKPPAAQAEPQTFEGLALRGFSVRIADRGAIDRLVATISASPDVSTEDVEAQLVVSLANGLAGLAQVVGEARVRAAAERFIEDRGTLTLAAEPERPIPLIQMGPGRASIERFGLSLEVKSD